MTLTQDQLAAFDDAWQSAKAAALTANASQATATASIAKANLDATQATKDATSENDAVLAMITLADSFKGS